MYDTNKAVDAVAARCMLPLDTLYFLFQCWAAINKHTGPAPPFRLTYVKMICGALCFPPNGLHFQRHLPDPIMYAVRFNSLFELYNGVRIVHISEEACKRLHFYIVTFAQVHTKHCRTHSVGVVTHPQQLCHLRRCTLALMPWSVSPFRELAFTFSSVCHSIHAQRVHTPYGLLGCPFFLSH